MNRVLLVAVLVLISAGGIVRPASAQGPVTIAIDGLMVDNVPEIKLLVTVRDANGVPVGGLTPEQFELVEDGRDSLPPADVSTQVNGQAVISAMLVVDISGSMKGKPIEEAKRAANSFIDKLGEQDRAGLVAFCDKVDTDPNNLADGKELGFTTDKNALRNVVDLLDTKVGWDTPLYDAIYKGIALTSREPVGKRAVILMTDGRDERDNAKHTPVPNAGSLTTPDDPINEATRQGIPVFAIGLGKKLDTKYLSRLALRTGGQYQETPNPEELTALFQKVLDQLKEQYVLTYRTPLKEDNAYHSLMVRVRAPQGQAFDEVKFWLGGDVTPTALVVAGAQPVIAQATAVPAPTPEPTTEGFFQKVKTNIQDTIEDKPGLAAAIGGGALLLIILIIVLVVIVARGRRAAAAEVVYEEPMLPAAEPGFPVTGPQPMGSPPPPSAAPTGWTEAAPSGWPAPGTGQPPAWAPPAQAAMPPGGGFVQAPAGGTRLIERAPKHLAMLVNKGHPDLKYDLKGTINVGRAPDNQVVIDHPTVSRHHAWVKEQEGEFLVFDIGSANGTFVNDQRIEAPQALDNGAIVRFGEVEFVFTRVF